LEQAGFIVVTANGPVEALNVLKEDSRNIDVMLTDVRMPIMGGCELAKYAVKIRPDMKVMYMSGYIEESVVEMITREGSSLLAKPFTLEILTGSVNKVLKRR